MKFIMEKLIGLARPTLERWGSKKLAAWAGSMYGINQLPVDSELGIALNGAYMAVVTCVLMFVQASSDKEKMKQLTAPNISIEGRLEPFTKRTGSFAEDSGDDSDLDASGVGR